MRWLASSERTCAAITASLTEASDGGGQRRGLATISSAAAAATGASAAHFHARRGRATRGASTAGAGSLPSACTASRSRASNSGEGAYRIRFARAEACNSRSARSSALQPGQRATCSSTSIAPRRSSSLSTYASISRFVSAQFMTRSLPARGSRPLPATAAARARAATSRFRWECAPRRRSPCRKVLPSRAARRPRGTRPAAPPPPR